MVSSTLWAVSQALVPVRIPLFFLVAGVVAQRLLTRPRMYTLRHRVAPLLWVFVLWSALFSVPFGVLTNPSQTREGIVDSLLQIPLGGNAYWFLFVLPVYLVGARLLARWPWCALALGAVLYVLSPWLAAIAPDGATLSVRRVTAFFLWFAIGMHSGRIVRRVAAAPWPCAIVASVAFVGIWFLQRGETVASSMTTPLLTVLGVTAILIVSAQSVHAPRLRPLLTRTSQLTLAIYVVHSFVLWSSHLLVNRTIGALPMNPTLDLIAVPFIVVALLTLSVGIDRVARHFPQLGLLALPTRGNRGRDESRAV